jgi:membrane protease YdiL (CAAX protease family)
MSFNQRRGIKNNYLFLLILGVALIVFIPLFIFRTIGPLDFWWWMSANLVILLSLSFLTDVSYRKELTDDFQKSITQKIIWGLVSAAVLYGVFFIGNALVRWLFDFAGKDISQVYGFKGGAENLRIGLLMLLVIGPGEELLWRGYVQGTLSGSLGKVKGFLTGVLFYTLIHAATGNLILILAALVGGLFWGWMYMKYRSMLMNIVSHVVWDIAIFLVFPLNG